MSPHLKVCAQCLRLAYQCRLVKKDQHTFINIGLTLAKRLTVLHARFFEATHKFKITLSLTKRHRHTYYKIRKALWVNIQQNDLLLS